MIPYGKQHITQADIDAVVEVLKGDFLTQGPKIGEFEQKFANYIGCKYAVAVNNGTAGLHLAALALDVKQGDKVITTPITFAASANCIRFCGGEVIFSDIDPETYLLDINKVRLLLETSPKGTYKGIIPVDFAGRAVDLEAYRKLAKEYDLWIIEDACHAPGGYFIDSNGKVQHCGNGQYADLAVFSFHPVKHIACGEGGMVTTNDEALYKKLLQLRTHGITRIENEFTNTLAFAQGVEETKEAQSFPAWYMEMQTLGYNYRLTDFQAALGISQLQRANSGIERRKEIAQLYSKAFEGKPYIKGHSSYIEGHAYHLYVIEVEDRLGLFKFLREQNVYAQIHYIPCHLMPYYRDLGSKEGNQMNAENYYKHCISLPMYPSLSNNEIVSIIELLEKYYGKK